MPEEDEFDEVVNSIEDLGDIANLVRCPNCNEMTDASKNVCESCGFLRGGERPSDEEEVESEDPEFEERLNMTLKPMVPSRPRARPAGTASEPIPGVADLEEALEYASGRPMARRSRSRVALREPARVARGSSALTVSSAVLVVAGIATYLLSFFFLEDRLMAGAAMVLGAVLIVVFGNVAVESAFASRRPVLVAEGGRRSFHYTCPACRTPLGADEMECPICGSLFDS